MSQSPFTPEFIEERRIALMDARSACQNQLDHLNDPIEEGGDAVDRTEAELNRKARIDAHSRNMRELTEIDAALTRINRGKYGICELTGNPISTTRLEAIPTARYDVIGQKKQEKMAHKRALNKHEDAEWLSGVEIE